jgi:NDP-sugar pyrophosphorylase family protein
MKAVVLVGGEGTRLRPLTETLPKPLLPLVDRPSLDHVLDHLAGYGVHEVVLSSSYLEETFHAFIQARRGDPSITWITETEPLGTGGAIVNALGALGTDDPFFALNGDILTDLDLTQMLARHRDLGAVATIALTHVSDARPYGLVPTDADGKVVEFREKPSDLVPGDINAGTYVIDPASLEGWTRGENVSIERQIFPALIAAGRPLAGFPSQAYWMDLGTPQAYLQAQFDLLDGRVDGHRPYPSPFVDADGTIDRGASVNEHVVVGPRATIGSGARVSDTVLHERAVVEPDAVAGRSILGPGSIVMRGGSVHDCVLGEGAVVGAGTSVHDGRVRPGERVGA